MRAGVERKDPGKGKFGVYGVKAELPAVGPGRRPGREALKVLFGGKVQGCWAVTVTRGEGGEASSSSPLDPASSQGGFARCLRLPRVLSQSAASLGETSPRP